MNRAWVGLGCASALLAGTPASALVQSQVTIGAPQIVVTDLDPDDGIPPAWIEGGWRPPYFDIALKAAPVANEVYGDGVLDDSRETAIGGNAQAANSGYFGVADLYSFTLKATPYSRVSVSVPYTLQATIDRAAGLPGDFPNVLTSLELNLLAINNLHLDEASGYMLYDDLAWASDFDVLDTPYDSTQRVTRERQRDGSLRVSFDNASASDAVFAFRAELVAFGNTGSVATVPEPATAMLWLLGAAGLGLASRRRCA